jgi:molecular chaperone IbpA
MEKIMRPNFNPLLSRIIGVDNLLTAAEFALGRAAEVSAFPPYNIVKLADNRYRVELAVAGFAENELSVETKEKVLVIAGTKSAEGETSEFLHRGIAARGFKREFQLADFVEVSSASLKNGILSIDLVREVPAAQQHRKVDIKGASSAAPAAVAEAA